MHLPHLLVLQQKFHKPAIFREKLKFVMILEHSRSPVLQAWLNRIPLGATNLFRPQSTINVYPNVCVRIQKSSTII